MATHNITLTATDKTSTALKNADKNLDTATKRALMFKGALSLATTAAVALGAALGISKAKAAIDQLDTLGKRAQTLGIDTEIAFARFQVASRLLEEGGLSAEEADRAFRNLHTRMQQGLEGNMTYATIMDKLKDSIFDANGALKGTDEVFLEVAKAIQAGTITVADAQKILGEEVGPKIFGIFQKLANEGTSVGAAMKEVADNMVIFSLEDAEKAAKFNDALSRLNTAFTALLQEALLPILPAMTTFVYELMADLPTYLRTVQDVMTSLQPVFKLLGDVLDAVIVPALGLLFDLLVDGASAVNDAIAYFGGLESIVNKVATIMKVMYEITTSTFVAIKDAVVPLAESAAEGVKEAWWDAYDYLVGNSVIPDLRMEMIKEFERMDEVAVLNKQTTESIMSDYDRLAEVMKKKSGEIKDANEDWVKSMSEDFNKTFADALVDGELNMASFAGFFKGAMSEIIQDALNGGDILSTVFSDLGGLFGGGGGGGGIGGFFSDVFSMFGGKAIGGPVSGNTPYIVGENGPELFVPSGNGTITPNNRMASSAPTINFNINAVDGKSVQEMLVRERKTIEGIVTQAYNRRGKQGIA